MTKLKIRVAVAGFLIALAAMPAAYAGGSGADATVRTTSAADTQALILDDAHYPAPYDDVPYSCDAGNCTTQ